MLDVTPFKVRYAAGEIPVPGYKLVGFLGSGSFGEVWEAEGPGDVRVAIKILNLGGLGQEREFKAISLVKKIRNPFLTSIYGIWLKDEQGQFLGDLHQSPDDSISDTSANVPYSPPQGTVRVLKKSPSPDAAPRDARGVQLIVAMGLGEASLDALLKKANEQGQPGLDREELLDYMEQVAQGIDYLNFQCGVIHRDVKPQNMLLVGGVAQVCDFGLAKRSDDMHGTVSNMLTAAYCAPEAFDAKVQPTPAMDQYALAVTYYELRQGQLPFPATSLAEVMHAKLTGTLTFTGVGREESEVLARATAVSPAKRFASCREFVRALRDPRLVHASLKATNRDWRTTKSMHSPPTRKSRGALGFVFMLLLLLGAVGGGAYYVQLKHPELIQLAQEKFFPTKEEPPVEDNKPVPPESEMNKVEESSREEKPPIEEPAITKEAIPDPPAKMVEKPMPVEVPIAEIAFEIEADFNHFTVMEGETALVPDADGKYRLQPGPHTLLFSAPEFRDQTETIDVQPGMPPLLANLDPLEVHLPIRTPPPPPMPKPKLFVRLTISPRDLKGVVATINDSPIKIEQGEASIPFEQIEEGPDLVVAKLDANDRDELVVSRPKEEILSSRKLELVMPLSKKEEARILWRRAHGILEADPQQTEQLLSEALKFDPNLGLAWRDRGFARQRIANLPDTEAKKAQDLLAGVEQDFQSAEKLIPTDYPLQLEWGKMLFALKKHSEAEAQLTKAIEINAKDTAARPLRAEIYLKSDRFELAMQDTEEIIANTQEHAQIAYAHYLQGLIAKMKKDDPLAIRKFEEAISLNNKFAEPHFERAIALYRTSKTAKGQRTLLLSDALLELTTASSLDKALLPKCMFYKASIQAELGNHANAVTVYNSLIESGKATPATLRNRAVSLKALGKNDEADRDLARAAEIEAQGEGSK